MATPPNKLSQFWQDLKRRNVIRVITVYTGAAFVIIELINNITEPLRLPEWTPTLVIVLLAIGFPIIIIISWIYDIHPEGGMVKTEHADKIKPEDVPRSSGGWKIASYISFVVILGLIALNIFGGKKGPGIDENLAKSIAVLPFENFSGDPGQDIMCEGLTDEIISNLFKLKSFSDVRPWTSVRTYKNSEMSATEIAEALHVNYILEGSYKQLGDDLKVTAHLIEPKSDNQIWLHDYEIPYTEVMGIPGEIAYQIADHLKAFMTKEEQQNISSYPTENLEAYELVQQMKSLFNLGSVEAVMNAPRILDLAEKAIALDPDYADPYAWKAAMLLISGLDWGTREMKSVAWEAEKNLNKALRIDPNNFMAKWGMQALNYLVKWDYIYMVKLGERYKGQPPSDINLNFTYADVSLKMGRFNEVLTLADQNYAILAQILLGNKDYARDLIENQFDSLEFNLMLYMFAGDAYVWLQEFDRVIFCFESVNASGILKGFVIPKYQADLAVAYFKTGRTDEARTLISELIGMSDTTAVRSPAYYTGWYYSWIGELDSAFYWLDKAVENRSPDLTWLKVDPAFDSLKDDPRYWDLYERTGFKAYDDYMASRKE